MRKEKNKITTSAILILGMLLLNGCTAKEEVLFVNATEILEDATQQNVTPSPIEASNMTAFLSQEENATADTTIFLSQEENATTNTTAFLSQEEYATADTIAVKESRRITVHVCGAVKKAGVFELEEGSRVMDAVLAAGGFSTEADEEYVNLATLLSDGDKVRIPTKEEVLGLSDINEKENDTGVTNSKNLKKSHVDTSDRININTAGMEELCTLPGIGKTRAESILAYREAHGVFSKIEDIMQVSGIKDSSFQKIKDRITVN